MRSNMNAPIAFLAAFVAYSCSQLSTGASGSDRKICFFASCLFRKHGTAARPRASPALVVVAIAGAAVIFLWARWFDRHRHVERD